MRAVLLLLVVSLLVGCPADEGHWIQTWWGPTDPGTGESPFPPGGSSQMLGMVHRFSSTDDRDLVEVVLLDGATSCHDYGHWLASVGAIQQVVDGQLLDGADRSAVTSYLCGELSAISGEVFGGEGRYRALHVLAEVTGGAAPSDGVFRAAPPASAADTFVGAEVLVPGTMVARLYERSQHGEGILPGGSFPDPSEDIDPRWDCEAAASSLVGEWEEGRATYPDRASIALQSATHRYYHHYMAQETVEVQGQSRPLGLVIPDWETAADEGGEAEVSLFGQVSRAPSSFPYQQLLLSTKAEAIPLEPCPELSEVAGVVWSELGTLPTGEEPSDSCQDSAHPGCWPTDPDPDPSCSALGPAAPRWLSVLLAALAAISLARPSAVGPSER